jgi:hypothetical protein
VTLRQWARTCRIEDATEHGPGSAHADPACCAWWTLWPTAESPLDACVWNQEMRAAECMLPKCGRRTRPWRAEVEGLTEQVKPWRSCT